MSMPIRTQTFVVEVAASIMPPLTHDELHQAVSQAAFDKESKHGMGALQIGVREVASADAWGWGE